MSKALQFYDSTGTRRLVKELYFYDAANNRRTVAAGYFYDESGVLRQFYTKTLPPQITTPAINDMTLGVAFSQQMVASGATPITWDLLPPNSWPPGISMNSTGLISGTPSGSVATWATVVRATNLGGNATRSYSWKVQAAPVAPVITTTVLDKVKIGTFFNQTLAWTGSTPGTFAVQAGTLPTGLTLSISGTLSGTPSAGTTYSFTARVTNAAGFDDQAFTGTIYPAIEPPVIVTATLPLCRVGSLYSQQLQATGDSPITWAVQAGALPAGLTLSSTGLLSGTPTSSTTASFTIRATNSGGTNDKAYSLQPWRQIKVRMTAGRGGSSPYQYGYRDSSGTIGVISPATVYCPPGDPSISVTGHATYFYYYVSQGYVIISYYNGTNWVNPGKACWTTINFGGTVGSADSANATYSWTGNVAEWQIPIGYFRNGDGKIVNGAVYDITFDLPAGSTPPPGF